MEQKQQDVSEKTTTRNGIAHLAAAYVKSLGELDNVAKNADNPHFGSTYADLGAVLDTVRPVFAANGLALLIAPGVLTGDKMSATWMLMHSTGEFIQGQAEIPTGKSTAQAIGSATTYIRRYITASIAAIAQVDDDGNTASEPAPRTKAAPKAKDSSYAATADALLAVIAGAQDITALESLKPEIAALGDQKVADAYSTKKRELKGKAGK